MIKRRLFVSLLSVLLLASQQVAAADWLINSYRFAAPVTGISLVGTASNQTTNGADLVLTLPGGIAQNDVVYAAYCVGLNGDVNMAVLSPAGYTELADVFGNDDTDGNLGVYRKLQTATPDSTITFEGNGNSNSSVAAVAYVLRGVNGSPTEDATTTTANGGNTANADPPSITTVTANAWVLATGGAAAEATGTPSGYSDLVFATEGDTDECIVAMARILKATAGAENPGAFGMSTSMTKGWAAATVAVRPAP